MTDKTQPRKGAATLMRYFGKKPGQNLSDFATELRALTDDDLTHLVGGIEDGTLDYKATA